jgi:hypothetical protein
MSLAFWGVAHPLPPPPDALASPLVEVCVLVFAVVVVDADVAAFEPPLHAAVTRERATTRQARGSD